MFLSGSFQHRHNGHAEEARQQLFETEALTLFEDILENGLSLRVRVTGMSMTPFLKGGEILTIKKEPHHVLRKGDLIFFKSSRGVPLLHRIIQKRESPDEKITFRTKGDGLIAFDEPVEYQRVLGKVSRIEKTNSVPGSKYINMESPRWRTINSIIARISFFKSYLYYALLKSKDTISSLIRD
jgi:signal peptidase I